jgi:hypothetical protein
VLWGRQVAYSSSAHNPTTVGSPEQVINFRKRGREFRPGLTKYFQEISLFYSTDLAELKEFETACLYGGLHP